MAGTPCEEHVPQCNMEPEKEHSEKDSTLFQVPCSFLVNVDSCDCMPLPRCSSMPKYISICHMGSAAELLAFTLVGYIYIYMPTTTERCTFIGPRSPATTWV